jgi:hypothetical protein
VTARAGNRGEEEGGKPVSETAEAEPRVIDEAVLLDLNREIEQAQGRARVDAARAEAAAICVRNSDREVAELERIREYVSARTGQPLDRVMAEAGADVERLEAVVSERAAEVERLREEARDWQGCRNIAQRKLDELRAQQDAAT